jgi:hypothetical protein
MHGILLFFNSLVHFLMYDGIVCSEKYCGLVVDDRYVLACPFILIDLYANTLWRVACHGGQLCTSRFFSSVGVDFYTYTRFSCQIVCIDVT